MTDDVTKIRDSILMALLPDVSFDGWSRDAIRKAAQKAGYEESMASAVFPGGVRDAVSHFSDWIDRQMLGRLADIAPEEMRIRDRVAAAVMERFSVMQGHRDAARLAFACRISPLQGASALKALWRTADLIWLWAGDTAQDYNRYTKRGLLSGVLASTALAWAGDESPDLSATRDFLGRRIKNVMQLGQALGRIKGLGARS